MRSFSSLGLPPGVREGGLAHTGFETEANGYSLRSTFERVSYPCVIGLVGPAQQNIFPILAETVPLSLATQAAWQISAPVSLCFNYICCSQLLKYEEERI
jgi:hypothetical protein